MLFEYAWNWGPLFESILSAVVLSSGDRAFGMAMMAAELLVLDTLGHWSTRCGFERRFKCVEDGGGYLL